VAIELQPVGMSENGNFGVARQSSVKFERDSLDGSNGGKFWKVGWSVCGYLGGVGNAGYRDRRNRRINQNSLERLACVV
jgi:hypothetical protein